MAGKGNGLPCIAGLQSSLQLQCETRGDTLLEYSGAHLHNHNSILRHTHTFFVSHAHLHPQAAAKHFIFPLTPSDTACTAPAEMLQHSPHHQKKQQLWVCRWPGSTYPSWPPTPAEMSNEALAWVCARGGIWLSEQHLSNRTGRSMHGPHAVCGLLLRPCCHA